MRCESADFIGARSGSIGCNKAGYTAATHPVDVGTHETLAQTGRVHIQPVERNTVIYRLVTRTLHVFENLIFTFRALGGNSLAVNVVSCLVITLLCKFRPAQNPYFGFHEWNEDVNFLLCKAYG